MRRIAARIDVSTKKRVDTHCAEHGVTRSHFVEQALRHALRAEIDAPPMRLVITAASGRRVLDRIATPGRPTRALRELMAK